MFRNWGFLLGELWVLLLLAALLGLLVGWIIWGRRSSYEATGSIDDDSLRAELNACKSGHAKKDARIAELEAKLAASNSAPVAAVAASAVDNVDYDGDGVIEGSNEGSNEGSKPATLTAARDGKADDLKQIKGVGPKMEKLCNKLGFYHFDQIASWTADEVAWVDANLEGFKGRVSRDGWVAQAKVLTAGGETAFSKKVEKGGVY